jgi:sigma-B regulation protein RsbU (phosphoserine phosphatase)
MPSSASPRAKAPRHLGIQAKYSLILGALLLVVAGSIISAALWFQERSMTEQALLRGQSIAVNVAAPAGDALLRHNDLLLVGLALSATHDHPNVAYVAILDGKGKVRGHPDPKALGKALDFKAQLELIDAPEGATVQLGVGRGVAVWDIAVPIRLKGTDKQLGTVHVGIERRGVRDSVRASLWKLALITLILLAAGLALTAASVELAVRPLRGLAHAARKIGEGDFETRVPAGSHDELGLLAASFNQMAIGLARAEQERAEHQRIESELDLARRIQAAMLPSEPPRGERFELAFRCVPAKELGGDFYDCIPLPGGRYGLLIADVSGKGVPAALNVVNLRNLFKAFAEQGGGPAEVVRKVNAYAYPDLKGEAFVTLVYAVFDPAEGSIRLLNAGHDPAYWLKADGSVQAFESGAMPVGIADADDFSADLQESAFKLGPGERLLLFTDGVTEAMDPSGRQFGLEALQACAAPAGGAGETVLRVADAVASHAAGQAPSDDVTLLALRWKG